MQNDEMILHRKKTTSFIVSCCYLLITCIKSISKFYWVNLKEVIYYFREKVVIGFYSNTLSCHIGALLEKAALGSFLISLFLISLQSFSLNKIGTEPAQTLFFNIAFYLLAAGFLLRISNCVKIIAIEWWFPIITSVIATIYFSPEAIMESKSILRNIIHADPSGMSAMITYLTIVFIFKKWIFWIGMFLAICSFFLGFLLINSANFQPQDRLLICKEKKKHNNLSFKKWIRGLAYMLVGLFFCSYSIRSTYYYEWYQNHNQLITKMVHLEYYPNSQDIDNKILICKNPDVNFFDSIFLLGDNQVSIQTWDKTGNMIFITKTCN